MEQVERELVEIRELNRTTRTADAESQLRRLIARLPRHELLKEEHHIRQAILGFLPKRKRSLLEALDVALAHRPSGSTPHAPSPGSVPSGDGRSSKGTANKAPTRMIDTARTGSGIAAAPVTLIVEPPELLIPRLKAIVGAEQRERALDELAASILHACGSNISDGSDHVDSLLSMANSEHLKQQVLAWLALAIEHIEWLYDIQTFRLNVVKLFDEVWRKDVYRSLNIDDDTQTHDKWRMIKGAVDSLARQIRDIRNGLTSLSMFGSVRQELKKALNSAVARATVWPIVPRDVVTLRLDEALTATAEYMEASPSAAFAARTRALDALQDYTARARESESTLVRVELSGIAARLNAALEEHFSASPLSKPATVNIVAASKKYPFDAVGVDCRVAVTVECLGPGHAFDVEIEYEMSDNLRAASTRQYLGNLQPGQNVEGIILPCTVMHAAESATVVGWIRWTNHGQDNAEESFVFELRGQPARIDWDDLANADPYSLEPVTEERELIGRTELLNELSAKLTANAVGSFVIYGQKRVGKTSLVRSLESRLKQRGEGGPFIIYLDGGDYVHPDPLQTIQRLGISLCEAITHIDKRFAMIPIPTFDGALSPIAGFLQTVLQIAPGCRIVFVLDEFDELPVQIYRRGPVGDAFFLTLRSVSAKPSFGFVLVGGEKMEFILSTQGDALNKFKALRVDYFDRDKLWSDFQDLVRRPTASWLEFADDAVVALYEASAGNPFFAKLICDELFRLVLQRRDAHVTTPEIRQAISRTLASAGSNRFSHFWEDGIFEESGDRVEERSMARRHLLLALADGLRRGVEVSKRDLLGFALRDYMSESEVSSELDSFERRKILESRDGRYHCKVGLFGEWLRDRGVQEIVTSFSDRNAALQRRAEEERERVPERELQELTDSWGPYKGQVIGPEAVRGWLAQCGNVAQQRMMFGLLQKIRFYTNAHIRAKMREADGIVTRRLVERKVGNRLDDRQRKYRDVIVSHLGGVAKSGARYGWLYADENNIASDAVIERDRLGRALSTLKDVNALILVDDFIGSGQSAIEAFRQLSDSDRDQLRAPALLVVYIVVCGFEAGRAKLEAALDEMQLPIQVHLCDPLTEADRCFADNSHALPDQETRVRVREIAASHGSRLVKNAPLGYADGQALVVFETNCPNNSLPILWAERADWRPLFRRQ